MAFPKLSSALRWAIIYALFVLFILLFSWPGNPEKTAGELLVIALEIIVFLPYWLIVDGIPAFIHETAKVMAEAVFVTVWGLLWLAVIGGGLLAVLWVVRYVARAFHHRPGTP